MNAEQLEIWQVVQGLNRMWTVYGTPEKLEQFFHKDMVAITPTDKKRVEGGEKCVAGWKRFADHAKIHSWRETDPKVQIYGGDKFAIVTYYFDMSFEMGGQEIEMSGRDMFALVKENEKWLVVADQFSPMPK